MKMRLTAFALLAAAGLLPAGAAAQPAAPPPDGPAYYFLLGRHYESAGEDEKALAALRKAVEMQPDSAELLAELAGFYARHDQGVDAVDTAEKALKLDPRNREANRLLGSIYSAYAQRRRALRPGEDWRLYVPRAIAALERAREDGAVDTGLDLTLARLYLDTNAFDKAIPLLRRVQAEQGNIPEVALLLASAQEGAGRPGEAVETLRQSLGDNPKFYRGWVLLGELSEKQGAWRDAADAYGRAQQLNARAVDLTARRAAALINAGSADTARDLLRDGAAKPDAPALVLYLYGTALQKTGDLAGAEEAARRLRGAAPDDPRGMYMLAQVLEARQDYPGAERALRDLLQRDPRDATALNYLGYMFAERGENLDEAVDLVRKALEIEPDNPSFLDSLGWAFFRQGKIDLADAPLTEAAAKLPRSSVVQEHLGDLRFKQRRFTDAADAWERSLAGDNESIDRSRILKKLQDARSRMEAR
jgi:tetratricopeptide (TPR) repeat protein